MTDTQDRLEERDRVATIRLILDAHERSGEPAGDVRWTDEAMRAVFTHYDAALRQSQDIEAAAHCPTGCGCRLWTEDADGRDCACDGPCCWDSWDDFIWNLLAYPQDAREIFEASRDMREHRPFPALAPKAEEAPR